MLEYKRSLLVRVAFEADRVLRRRGPHLFWSNRAVWIVAVRALDKPLIDAMVERHLELRLLLQVAGVAELRLGLDQQEFLRLCVMGRVTGDAAHVALSMQRVHRIHVLGATGMARQTAVVDVFGRMIFEDKDLRYVAASGDVRCTRTMATFASLLGWTSVRVKCCLPVRGLLPSLVNVLMAGRANFRTHIAGSSRVLRIRLPDKSILVLGCQR